MARYFNIWTNGMGTGAPTHAPGVATMRNVMRVFGWVLFIGCGLIMFIFQLSWFHTWWGRGGLFVGLFVPPAAALFPYIFLAKEGFSAFFFGLWTLGIAGLSLPALLDRD